MKLNITKTDQKHSHFRRRTELSRSGEAKPKAIGFCGSNQLFVEQRSTANYYTPYKFSGKEKDEETSYSYFGARYYMSDVSVWLSVDPLANDAPGWTPYRYCFNNPIRFIDPDGRSEDGWIKDKNNKVVWNDNATSQATIPKGCTYIGENSTDILRFYGFNFKISPLSTSRLGFIFLDDSEQGAAYHFVNVKVTSNLSIEANTNMDPKSVSADNKLGRVFNGINLTLSNSSTNSGTSEGEIEAGGSFSVNYGGKDYTGKAQAMNASSLFGTGSTNTRSTVSLPSSELKTYKRLYSAEVSGSWGARRAGEGYSPVVWHGLVPIPRTYWHRWTF